MNKLPAITVFVLWMAAGLCMAQSEPSSLADLARKNKAGKQAPAKVITNDDAPSAPASSSISASAASAGSSAAPADSASSATDKKDDKKNAKAAAPAAKEDPKVAELKKQLASYTVQRDAWKNSAKRYEDLLANETSDFRRDMYQDSLQNDRKNVAFFQEKVDSTQADLDKAKQPGGNQNTAANSSPDQGSTSTPPPQ